MYFVLSIVVCRFVELICFCSCVFPVVEFVWFVGHVFDVSACCMLHSPFECQVD